MRYRKNFVGLKNKFESAMVNEPSGFELLRFDCILIIIMFQYIDKKNIITNIYLYPGKCVVRPSLFRFYCLKGANYICLENNFYELHLIVFMNQSRIMDDF